MNVRKKFASLYGSGQTIFGMLFVFLRQRLLKYHKKLERVYKKDRKPDLKVKKSAFLWEN